MGILSGVEVEDGQVIAQSGTLRRYSWDPGDEQLDPISYDFWPSADDEV